MLIAQVTDIHIGFDPGNADEYNMQRFKAVLRRMESGPNRPDLLLLTGDLTENGDPASYERLAQALADCSFPVWPLAGNHDLREPLLAAFPAVSSDDGFVHYAIDLPGLRILAIDTLEVGRHGGGFCEARAAWLSRELAAHPEVPTVIAMHHPPFESGIAWLDCDAREPWIARFAEAIAGHRQVRSIMAGHLHRTIHTAWEGTALTVCASTAPLVALDLNPVDPDQPDGRDMITDELPVYALHRWDGTRLVTHVESVGGHGVLARYDENLQAVVRMIEAEHPRNA
ncbi:metallophosphoesterase [Novosphingobium mangrovi (ex Huang et al. 2023)]|uniref:Metallophosphoesterase n=1 Tax=Novosphingobium mangrovi (ex Huang et al. 2023) TaxID=2976432 RepID=A0ABT2I9U3_9SPHN|nr:metallophosphoesterase [Novosphingobium mangrovi (ex Huang et al. 2023)]MCT2401539.1 metallophosphoesterase [Novosphingobium mangrovi (ex Huang et al. 2023)]